MDIAISPDKCHQNWTQALGTYIYRQQATLAEWVTFLPIYEVCDRGMSYKVCGWCRDPWWQKNAARKQLRYTLKYILVEARVRRRESGRRGEGRGR